MNILVDYRLSFIPLGKMLAEAGLENRVALNAKDATAWKVLIILSGNSSSTGWQFKIVKPPIDIDLGISAAAGPLLSQRLATYNPSSMVEHPNQRVWNCHLVHRGMWPNWALSASTQLLVSVSRETQLGQKLCYNGLSSTAAVDSLSHGVLRTSYRLGCQFAGAWLRYDLEGVRTGRALLCHK